MLVIGREQPDLGEEGWLELFDSGPDDFRDGRFRSKRYASVAKDLMHRLPGRSGTRAFPDVRWMEISSVLEREQAAGRQPKEIKQIEFVGETLDMASVLRWRRRILADQAAAR